MLKHALVLSSILVSSTAFAQSFELPRPSPNAKVMQTAGLTEITVDYSSPGVKGRKVWGEVVKYGEVWRAGANAATKITFSKDVKIGTTDVPAGTYSLFVIPQQKGNWTIVINKDVKASTQEYKQELDVVRVEAKPEAIAMRERLAYSIPDFSNDAATVALDWEKVRVSFKVVLATDAQVTAAIKGLDEGSSYVSTARYMLEQKKDYDQGLKFVDKALSMKEDWLGVWTKAQLLAAKGDKKGAFPLAQKAQELGEKNPQRFFFAADVKQALTQWKN